MTSLARLFIQTLPVDRDLVKRVQMEFLEMPGLCLTSRQARRLLNLDQALCDAVLVTLVAEGFLSQTRGGAYLRSGT